MASDSNHVALGLVDGSVSLGGYVAMVDMYGTQLGSTIPLHATRTPWRIGDVSVAHSAGAFGVITSSGGCDYFGLGSDGQTVTPAVPFSMMFCSDLQAAADGWTVLDGAPDPTSETVTRLDATGHSRGPGRELLHRGESRIPTRRVILGDGSFYLLAQRPQFGAPIEVEHVAADASTILDFNQISGFSTANLVSDGTDAWIVGLMPDPRVPSSQHAGVARVIRSGGPISQPVALPGTPYPQSAVVATVAAGSIWVMFASNAVSGGLYPLVVQRTDLDGLPTGSSLVFGGTPRPSSELFIVPTADGLLALWGFPNASEYAIDAVRISCE